LEQSVPYTWIGQKGVLKGWKAAGLNGSFMPLGGIVGAGALHMSITGTTFNTVM
jgi:hypothetical protein